MVEKLGHLHHEKANLTSLVCKTQEEVKTIEEGNEKKIREVENKKKQLDKEKRKLAEINDLTV